MCVLLDCLAAKYLIVLFDGDLDVAFDLVVVSFAHDRAHLRRRLERITNCQTSRISYQCVQKALFDIDVDIIASSKKALK